MSRSLVVNASPLILLARIGRLDLLASLADEIAIPERVIQEVVAGSHHDHAARIVSNFAMAKVVKDVDVPERIRLWDLGPGESQVLSHVMWGCA